MSPIFPRRCGPCTYCCIALDVPALGKLKNTPCDHLSKAGCGIHTSPNRPAICGEFSCLWLLGGWGEFDTRPDNTKVLPVVVGDWERIIIHALNKEATVTKKIQRQMKKYWGRVELQVQIGEDIYTVEHHK